MTKESSEIDAVTEEFPNRPNESGAICDVTLSESHLPHYKSLEMSEDSLGELTMEQQFRQQTQNNIHFDETIPRNWPFKSSEHFDGKLVPNFIF